MYSNKVKEGQIGFTVYSSLFTSLFLQFMVSDLYQADRQADYLLASQLEIQFARGGK